MLRNATAGVSGTIGAFNFIRRVGFPTTPEVVTIFATVSFLTVIISLPAAGENLSSTLAFGVFVLVGPAVIGEFLNSILILHKDHVLDFRRLMGLELFSLLPLVVFLPLSVVVSLLSGIHGLWADGFLLGLVVSFPMRFLTTFAVSSLKVWRRLSAPMSTPLLISGTFFAVSPSLFPSFSATTILLRVLAVLLSGLILSTVGVSWIVKTVETRGASKIRDSPMGLFRAFLDHWLSSKPEALEERLTELGTNRSIETRILNFSGRDSEPKASVIVSNFHPGPYRDLGSAGLPSELKHSLERSVGGVVQVPHGISNHQLNIVSRQNIARFLESARVRYPSECTIKNASIMIRERAQEAKVTGQAFGSIALLTITLAPTEMEDLPSSLLEEIEEEAFKRGFELMAIDAHNSLAGQTSITSIQARSIVEAATKVFDGLKAMPREPFKVGAAEDPLGEFPLEDGIGPGGLSVLTVENVGQVAAYVTIDGNNMQPGLRDRILESLRQIGVADAEIMTTDTHLVTGLVRSPLGYHPVGEHLNRNLLVRKITDTVARANQNTEASSAGFSKFTLQLHVLGSETFQGITSFVGTIARQIERSFYWLEIASIILGLAVLSLL